MSNRINVALFTELGKIEEGVGLGDTVGHAHLEMLITHPSGDINLDSKEIRAEDTHLRDV